MDRTELQTIAGREQANRKPCRILCCTGSGCQAARSLDVKSRLEKAVTDRGLGERMEVVGVGCLAFCGQGPLIEVSPGAILFQRVAVEQAESIVGELTGELPSSAQRGNLNDPFYTGQLRIVREFSGRIDPERIEDAIALGAYQALDHAVNEMSPAEVVQEITRSGLRGRGGAGYPTGLKWSTVAKMPSSPKFVICNGDEGDPGAFMDRSVMEDDPHRILEGMAIAGYAVGANQGYIYVRAEYPLAVARLRKAIQQATRLGILGAGLFGTSVDFKVEIRIGAGAFVCGEETALIASVEGKRGVPRVRPPYPAESGLWGQPTLINNVETYANVPAILRRGSAWFASIGTERSKGTKVFSLTGKIRNSGLIEVPMGATLRYIVEDMGGGVPDGRVKAVQTGGPSGGCIPADKLDVPVDYDSLTQLGSIMGSGGMIVMDQDTNMVEVARFFMEFCMDESCGKCIPCRAGTVQMHGLLDRLARKRATKSDLDRLIQLCHMTQETSLCGLGQTAPNPVLSTLRDFRNEYEALLQAAPPRGADAAARVLTIVLRLDAKLVVGVAFELVGQTMSVVTLTINDHPVSATAGDTLLTIAKEAGVSIPTLCHLDGVSDVGACRLCLVEIEGTPKLQAACVTRAAEGMRVRTHTAKLLEYRKMIVELLLAEGNHICSVCVANGNCELQDHAATLGVDHVRFDYQSPQREVDVSHERFGVDHNRCILCTRCIRVCDEIEGAHTWDMSGRGHASKVITDMNQPWGDAESCTSCGKCVQACPTGALFRHGATVAEMEKDKAKLAFLVQAREKKQWLV